MARRRRSPITKPAKTGLQTDFEKHSESVYSGMRARFGARKNDDGRITRAARPIPFTLGEFRAWLLAGAFRGSWDNAVQCCYCKAWVNAVTFVVDHKQPVKYGGSLGTDNLAVCCEACNCAKGVLSEDGFRRLCEFSLTLHPQDSADMFGRLKNGAGYMRLKIQSLRGRPKTSSGFVLPALSFPTQHSR